MMEPEFDFDELINDDIEDAFGEPEPQYDDAFLEEMERQEANIRSKGGQMATDTGSPDTVMGMNEKSANSPAEDTMDVDNDEDFTGDIREAIAKTREATNNSTDIYSFERYDHSTNWRKENVRSPNKDTMKATSWKSSSPSNKGIEPLRRSSKISHLAASRWGMPIPRNQSPASQLLELMSEKRQKSAPGITKRISLTRMASQPKPGTDSVSMTLGDGSRVFAYMRKMPDGVEAGVLSKVDRYGSQSAFALGVSIAELKRRVTASRRQREHWLKRDSTPSTDADDTISTVENDKIRDQLWVDKHAPSSFAHLLSDERTNREVVRALREWDPYVFNRDPPPRNVPSFSRTFGQNEKDPKKAEKKTKSTPKDRRPDEQSRVILLSGPPGVGKTTLAHIIARHVGYRPLEVNGSDDRTASKLMDRVVRAMESKTLDFSRLDDLDDKARPNCLILDEIDGADAKGAVKELVNIIRADIPVGGSKGKKSSPYLRRPIIFICNNKFSPALRPLLPYAVQFNVNSPPEGRLVSRLRSILNDERLSVSGGSTMLNQLVKISCGDIRSCLHTLQFVASQARHEATHVEGTDRDEKGAVDISSALMSSLNGEDLKDRGSDVAGTLAWVFRKQKKTSLPGSWITKPKSSASAAEQVLEAVQAFGDSSRILDCMFLNTLRVSYIDPSFDRCAASHELLSDSDLYRSHKSNLATINSAALHAMQSLYTPTAAAAVHLICRVEQRPDLVYTTKDFQNLRYRREDNTALWQKFSEGLSPGFRSGRCSNLLVTEMIPYVLWVLSAGEGSSALDRGASSFELLNKGELAAFNNHVSALRALGLTYVSQKHGEFANHHSPTLRLEPPIDRFSEFMGLQLSSERRRRNIAPMMKELLAQSAAIQVISFGEKKMIVEKPHPIEVSKREATLPDAIAAGSPSKRNQKDYADALPPTKRSKSAVTAQNFLGIGARKAKAARNARCAARVGYKSTRNKVSYTGSGIPFKEVIRLKYVKGFTEAVRTPCRLDDLK